MSVCVKFLEDLSNMKTSQPQAIRHSFLKLQLSRLFVTETAGSLSKVETESKFKF